MAGIPIALTLPNVLGALNPGALAPTLSAAARVRAAMDAARKSAPKMAAKSPSALEKILSGLNDALSSPNDAGMMGFGQGLLAASAPHLLTPIPMGEALGMGLASSQAYQKAALANAMQRAVLPMTQAETGAIVHGLQGPSAQGGHGLLPQTLLYKVLGGSGAAANLVKMNPALNRAETAARESVTPYSQAANTAVTSALHAAQGGLPLVRGTAVPGSIQNPSTGATAPAPGAGPTAALLAAAAGYGGSQGKLPAQITAEQAHPERLGPGTVLGALGGQVPLPGVVRQGLGSQTPAARQQAVGTAVGLEQAAAAAHRAAPFMAPGMPEAAAPQNGGPSPFPSPGGSSPLPMPPPGTPSGAGVTQGRSLIGATLQQTYAKQTAHDLDEANDRAEVAKSTLQPLHEMLTSLQQIRDTGNYNAMYQKLGSVANYLGIQVPKYSAMTQFEKYRTQLVGAAVHAVSARASTQEMNFMAHGVPGYTMPGEAPLILTAQLIGVQKYALYRANALQAYTQAVNATGAFRNTSYGFEKWWNNTGMTPSTLALSSTLQALNPKQQEGYVKNLNATVTGRRVLKQLLRAQKFEAAHPDFFNGIP